MRKTRFARGAITLTSMEPFPYQELQAFRKEFSGSELGDWLYLVDELNNRASTISTMFERGDDVQHFRAFFDVFTYPEIAEFADEVFWMMDETGAATGRLWNSLKYWLDDVKTLSAQVYA